MDIATFTIFLGWVSLINLGLLLFSTLYIYFFRAYAVKIHTKMFGLKEADASRIYFQVLGHYKILIIMFNLVPYFALRIIS